MKKKLILGIFDRRPLIWLHYILLVFAIYILFLLGNKFLGLASWNWWQMLIFWFVAISISDQVIHRIIGVD